MQRNRDLVLQVIAGPGRRLPALAAAGPPEEHIEEVFELGLETRARKASESAEPARASGESFTRLAKPIILAPFFRVLENIVGRIDLLELLFPGLITPRLVRV
jgi:hypothetical protein